MNLLQLLRLPLFGLQCGSLMLLLVLLGKSSAVQAQPTLAANRWHVEPGTRVYLDGQHSTTAAIDQLNDAAIGSVEGMSIQATTDHAKLREYEYEYLVLTTKANSYSPAVLALADKLHLRSAYTTRPALVSAIAPAALAYITSHYPKAWLGGEVLEMTRKSTGAVKYRVQLADNWGWRYVSFTEAGEFVDEGGY